MAAVLVPVTYQHNALAAQLFAPEASALASGMQRAPAADSHAERLFQVSMTASMWPCTWTFSRRLQAVAAL